jgi:hypothetical protein
MDHHPILDSLRPIVANARWVTINDTRLKDVVATIEPESLKKIDLTTEQFPRDLTLSQSIGFILIYDALNFYFWGEPKWTVMKNGQPLGGSYGLLECLKVAIDSGAPLLTPEGLQHLTEAHLADILKANTQIPFLHERLRLLQDMGKVLLERSVESWSALLEGNHHDAFMIAERLTHIFPMVFKDEAMYQNQPVRFWKRAQLAALHLSHFIPSLNISGLTALADYKIPNVLRQFGILEYHPVLAEKIEKKEEIVAGSEEEMEIRASMVIAVDLATKELQTRFPEATAIQLNDIFWRMGRTLPTDAPHHRTKTIWY